MDGALDFKKEGSALIIVDMQRAFLSPEGSLARMGLDTSRARRAVEPVARIRKAFSEAGLLVLHLKHTHRPDGLDAGMIAKVFPPIMAMGHCHSGTADAEIVGELAPSPGEIVVEKYRFSGFFNTSLDSILRSLAIERLVVVGIATNVCVESTVRDAFYRDYHVFVPEDCTAAFDEASEKAALANFRFAFARVTSLAELLAALRS